MKNFSQEWLRQMRITNRALEVFMDLKKNGSIEEKLNYLFRLLPIKCEQDLLHAYWIQFDDVKNLNDLKHATPASEILRVAYHDLEIDYHFLPANVEKSESDIDFRFTSEDVEKWVDDEFDDFEDGEIDE
jgi:hypothetical protein